MYLSRLILNPRDRIVWRELSDCQAMHRRVMSAFPDAPDAAQAREEYCVLYRVEVGARGQGIVLLVQSAVAPDWSELPAGYLGHAGIDENPSCKQLGTLYESFRAGALLRFRLRANPTRKIETKSGADGARRNGRRVEIRDEDGQLAWLARKGEQHGFRLSATRAFADVPNMRAVYEDKVMGRRREKDALSKAGPASRLSFGSVLFDGELTVTNATLFKLALLKGIGTGRAYGFGLLSVARVAVQ